MEFLTLFGGAALGVIIGSAIVKSIETNSRIRKLEKQLEEGEEAIKRILPNLAQVEEAAETAAEEKNQK